jgi:DNA-binding response OmpR family regulator
MFTIPCRRRILLVDEDVELRTVLGHLLAAENFDVCEADDGEQAVSLLCRPPLDLVIAELKPADNEGIEIIAEMCRAQACRRFIATVQPGRQTADFYAREAERLGVQSVLVKPFSPRQFLSAVHEAFAETDGHVFSPIITLLASRPHLPATRTMTGTLRTGTAVPGCSRGLRRWHRGTGRNI